MRVLAAGDCGYTVAILFLCPAGHEADELGLWCLDEGCGLSPR
jgi:hypothetical protein